MKTLFNRFTDDTDLIAKSEDCAIYGGNSTNPINGVTI